MVELTTRAGRGHVLLAGQQRAGHAAGGQAVAALQRQQAQRREVGALLGLGQALEGGVGLAAVGRAHVQVHLAVGQAGLGEAVGVALEGQLAVEALERQALGHLVLPAVLGAGAGGHQVGQGLRRGALGLQARQQRGDVLGLEGIAAREQAFEVGGERGSVGPLRVRAQRGLQRGGVTVAVEAPDGLVGGVDLEGHGDLPGRVGERERLAHAALPVAGVARDAQAFERGAALQHQRARARAGADGGDVGQRGVDVLGRDPAARALAGHALLQLHVALAVEVALEAGGVLGDEVGRLDHLRQQVGGLAQLRDLFERHVRRQAGPVVGVGQVGAGVGGAATGGRGGGIRGVGHAAR
jgi:hypothetical protein